MNKLQVNVKCPYCRHSLMDEAKIIEGFPSVKVIIQYSDKRGFLHLSSIYGSYTIESEIHVPLDEIVLFFCPFCQASLLTKNLCKVCDAPMTSFELFHGGKVEICTRRGCKEHFIEFSNLEQKISKFYNTYEVFADPSRKEQEPPDQ